MVIKDFERHVSLFVNVVWINIKGFIHFSFFSSKTSAICLCPQIGNICIILSNMLSCHIIFQCLLMPHFQSNFWQAGETRKIIFSHRSVHRQPMISKVSFSNEIIMEYNMTITDLKIY